MKDMKFDNFTENEEEVCHRIQHLMDYHGLEIRDCHICGNDNLACPNCHGEVQLSLLNPGKCDCSDCPVNPIVPMADLEKCN